MRKRQAGFTLIEYLVVLAMIGTILMVLFLAPVIWNFIAPKFSEHAPLFAQWWINLGKLISLIILAAVILFTIFISKRG